MSTEIFIKTINNESHRFDVDNGILVSELKTLILDSTDVPPGRQRLIYRGHVLQDDNSLQHYSIESGHTIHMVARPANATPVSSPGLPTTGGTVADNARAPTRISQGGPLMALLNPLYGMGGGMGGALGGTGGGSGGLSELLQGGARQVEPIGPPRNMQSLEHIRQGVLTLHSLRASMPAAAFIGSGEEVETGQGDMDVAPNTAIDSSDKVFYTGQWVDVKDTVNQWLEASVMQIDAVGRKVYIHYNGWPTHWDEWMDINSPRISPFRTRTIHSGHSALQCPTPNTIASFAPITGRDDIRTLLPGLLETHEALGAMLRQAVALSGQSLTEDPTMYDNTPATTPGIATGMPWDILPPVPEVPHAAHTVPVQPHTTHVVPDTPCATQRLANLSQLMVPLLDRFGRVLTDIAPHLNIEYSPPPTEDQAAETDSTPIAMATQPSTQRPIQELVRDLSLGGSPVVAGEETENITSNTAVPDPTAPANSLASMLAANLPPSLRHLLQPRPPSPPPEQAYRQLINTPASRGIGGMGGVGINHLVDIHIHAILTPSRGPNGTPGQPSAPPIPIPALPPVAGVSSPSPTSGVSSGIPASTAHGGVNSVATSRTTHVSLNNEYSSDDDVDYSGDDDDSVENENDDSDIEGQEALLTGAVSTLLSSMNNHTYGADIRDEALGDASNVNAPSDSTTPDLEEVRGTTASTSTPPLTTLSTARNERDLSVIITATNAPSSTTTTPTSNTTTPTSNTTTPSSNTTTPTIANAVSRPTRRRVDGDSIADSDLSAKERSTAAELVEKYRSREKERRTRHSVPNLLRQSLSVSPECRSGKSEHSIGGGRGGGETFNSDSDSFSPATITPLNAPLEGFDESERELRFTESAVAQSMEFEEREALESNILEVQKIFERNRRNSLTQSRSPSRSPPVSPLAATRLLPRSPQGISSQNASGTIRSSCLGGDEHPKRKRVLSSKRIPLFPTHNRVSSAENTSSLIGGSNYVASSATTAVGVATSPEKSSSPSNKSPSSSQGKPSLISRFKRAVTFTENRDIKDK